MRLVEAKIYAIVPVLAIFAACGNYDLSLDESIRSANILLSYSRCDEALKELNTHDFQHDNSAYIVTYASAQACKSNFNLTHFLTSELSNLGSGVDSFLSFLTTMSSSPTDATNDVNFINLRSAINTLLYAGNVKAPSFASKERIFGDTTAQDMGMRTLYLLLAQLGKYFYLFGNPNGNNGQKGTGPGPNTCLADYTTPIAQAALTASLSDISPCSSHTEGHNSLDASADADSRKSLMCEGIVLFNNLLDTMGNLRLNNKRFDALSTLQASLHTLCTTSGLTNICTEMSQKSCEDNAAIQSIEIFFIGVFERLFTDA